MSNYRNPTAQHNSEAFTRKPQPSYTEIITIAAIELAGFIRMGIGASFGIEQ